MSAPLDHLNQIFIKDLTIEMSIGIHDHEKSQKQPVIINLTAWADSHTDDYICYEALVNRIEAICSAGHIDLVEELSSAIFEACFDQEKIKALEVQIEKPNAIKSTKSVGIKSFKHRAA